MVPTQVYFQLPSTYQPFAELLSANAQMYLQCQCGWEDRINILYGFPPQALLTEPCSQCKSTEHRVVRHEETVHGSCLDCGHDLAGFPTMPWNDLVCPNCRSHRLQIERIEIDPPYPSKFGEAGDRTPLGFEGDNYMRKDQPWGVDPHSDAMHLQLETKKAVHFHPSDSYEYVRCEFLFGQGLLGNNQYREDDAKYPMLISMLASLMRDCFRQMGQLPEGIKALDFDEVAAGLEKDPVTKALWEHNVAIAINSLLARYPEKLIAEATERPEIRREGVAYAVRALRVYVEEAGKQAQPTSDDQEEDDDQDEEDRPPSWTFSDQVARTFHLIGDLMRIGDSTNEERRQALEAYGEALKWTLPENLVPGLLQSRGETTLMLQDATREELASAWTDLETALNADTKRLGRSMPWAVLWHMAQIAERLDDGATELQTLDKAARVAMAVVRLQSDEYSLQLQSEPMADVFDSLAHRHAEQGQAGKSLSAAEALRAATVRLHTKTEEEKKQDLLEMVSEMGRDLARAHLRQAGEQVNLVDSVLSSENASIDSIEPAIQQMLARDTDTPTAIVSFSNPITRAGSSEIVAFVCANSAKSKDQIQCQILRPDFTGTEWDAALVRPGPFREKRLRRMHAAVAHALLAPLLPVLEGMGIQRIVFSLPGILSRYSFEAAPVGDGEGNVLIQRWEVAYVPAIALALDEAQPAPRANGNLLVVGYQGEDLTNAALEVKHLRELFGDNMTLLSGEQCNKVSVLEHLSKPYGYIHFVCHGTYDVDMPLNAALHLVPDVEDDSQRVTAADIFANVKFPGHPLVTMSACSTALMSTSAVNNCHGLTGSFLRAGACGVVGSRWPVYDDISALFMSSLYGKIVGGGYTSPLNCLTAVQRELAKDHGMEDFASFGYMGIP